MSKERGAELFRALHAIIDAVTNLNLRYLEAEARASTSSPEAGTSASASAKGKAKDPNPDWTEVPYNPLPITPLSTRPRFSQVVGSSSESPIFPPSRIAVEATLLAEYPIYTPATIAAWATGMNAQGTQNQGNQPQGQDQRGPQGPEGEDNGDGNGGGQDGGEAPLPYNNAAQFLAAWNTAPTDQAKDNLEQEAEHNRSPVHDVQFAAMLKINLQLQASVGQSTHEVLAAQGQEPAANVLARQAQVAAHGAANVDRFRPTTPSKYGDKKKGKHVGHWIPIIEDYLQTAPDADYIRLASFYLEGGPRAL
jgi:hypothetical protein